MPVDEKISHRQQGLLKGSSISLWHFEPVSVKPNQASILPP